MKIIRSLISLLIFCLSTFSLQPLVYAQSGDPLPKKSSIEFRVYQYKGETSPDTDNLILEQSDSSENPILDKQVWDLMTFSQKFESFPVYELKQGKYYIIEALNIVNVDTISTMFDARDIQKIEDKPYCDRPMHEYLGDFEKTRRAWLLSVPKEKKNKFGELSVEVTENTGKKSSGKLYVIY